MNLRFLVSLFILQSLFTNNADAAPGDWPEPRQNPRLTAIQPLAGNIKTAPSVTGRIDLGRSVPAIAATTLKDGTPVGLSIVAGALHCYATDGALRWKIHPDGINFETINAHEDLDGDGEPEVLLQAGRPTQPFGAAVLVALDSGEVLWRYDVEPMSYAWYLYAGNYWPNDTKKQIIVLEHAYPPDKDNGYIALFAYEGERKPVQKWRYAFDEYTCFPTLLQNDIDADGVKEVVVETHSRMWHLDALMGAVKHHIHWDTKPANERSYGLVKFTDLNKDGRDDFLCIANFAQHHEVLLNKDGKFEKAWGHGWAESVTTGKVATVYPDEPDVDVDGDGKLDIVLSMFNSEDENAWLLRVYDALTGELKYRVPGVIAMGTGDLDGDGAAEVLANASTDPARAKLDGVRLLSFKDKKARVIWEDATCTAIAPDKRGELRVEKGGERLRVQINPSDTISLEKWEKPNKKENKPVFTNVPASVGPPMPKLLAADINSDGKNDLLLYQDQTARAYTWTGSAFENIGEFTSSSIPALVDLDGDGRLEVVTTDVAAAHTPVVEAKTPSLEGRTLWRTQLPDTDRKGLPHPRLAYLRTIHFTGSTTPDIYLYAGTPLVRSVAINGRNGEIIWEKGETPGGIERYWAPTVNLASEYDYDADGKYDLVFTNPDYYCVASALSGDALIGPSFPPTIFSQSSQGLYTLPAILDRKDQSPLVALVAGHYFQGVMSIKTEPLWSTIPGIGTARGAEEGFMQTTDGAWLMGYGEQAGDLICTDVQTGARRWSMAVGATCSDVVTCDIDGDGAQEFVFGTSHGALYAVGDGGDKSRVLWKTELGSASGTPIVADLTGDGKSDIIVPTADGYVSLLAIVNATN
ncbi:MAG: VCBS repeat-containing protein [Candidatus Hydrogenedentes bacterium]|nr:VCBS repeat-containing protein [Candidatus Hydrogenedentota bacterium]